MPADAPQVADRLHSAAIHLLRRVRTEDDASGLPAPRLSALSVLVFGGPRTLGALAALEQVRPPTMSAIVAELVRAGMVVREPDRDDRRVVRLRATAEGERLMHEGRRRRTAWLAARLADLPPDELATLDAAARLIEALSATAPTPRRP